MGKPVVFDMDMSVGDFVALFYLLKLPVELINLKGILVTSTGWANAATIDVIYDVLHMMGRDDIPVGLGDVFAIGPEEPAFPILEIANIGRPSHLAVVAFWTLIHSMVLLITCVAVLEVTKEDEIQYVRLDYKYDRGVITMENPVRSEMP
ncbi:unnamed protein product [Ilex paraguariensis]|uniref:Inosine/uridine-preferring nucleoside hydrolase domain-containing protein n=1 Tax=Ilex paraguariensis TaxID=185542 RepID=A0ABC8TMF1_9AQUA